MFRRKKPGGLEPGDYGNTRIVRGAIPPKPASRPPSPPPAPKMSLEKAGVSMSTITSPSALAMLRETFCVAQARITQARDPRRVEYVQHLQWLIDDIDRQRPLGPDGKHGDRHTDTCGCEETAVSP